MRKRRFGKPQMIAEAILFIYLFLVGSLFLAQRNMVFVPDRLATTPAENGVGDMSVIQVKTPDGLTLHGWYKAPADKRFPVIIHFHGNGGGLRYRGGEARPFLDIGYGFLFAEYRGYSGNPGKPGEQGIYKDARAYIDWLAAQGISQEKMVFYGQSLGTGVATKMATEYPHAAALILSSPYTSLPDVAARTYFFVPVHLLMLDKFDSFSRISQIKMPVLILHGEKDNVVSFAFGKKLYEAANDPKEFAVYPEGTHFNINASGGQTRMLSFLEKHVKP